MSIAAIVLAAGFSRRFGSDKRLACVNGEPMLLASLRNLQAALEELDGAELQVVIRARDNLIAPMLASVAQPPSASIGRYSRVTRAPLWPVGMGVSIAAGLEALLQRGVNPHAVAVCLADMPFLQPQTITQLLRAADENAIAIPVFAGERGHPVVLGRAFFTELLALRGGEGAKKIIRRHARAVREIEVTDPAIVMDIDRPQDFHFATRPGPVDRVGRVLGRAADAPLPSHLEQ